MSTRQRLPIGSAPWIVSEQNQVNDLVVQEIDEFSFSVRNEMEWLNEHMAEIFAPGNVNIINVFKTPGKLKGRTPYTAKKRAANLQRAPLTDIFAPNPRSSPLKSPAKTAIQFNIAEDVENKSPYRLSPPKPLPELVTRQSPVLQNPTPKPKEPSPAKQASERRTTNETFHSAKEKPASQETSQEDVQISQQEEIAPEVDLDVASPSDTSSPIKPLVRKSSLTFAALPAREPLAKNSLGPRTSHLGRTTGSRITNGPSQTTTDKDLVPEASKTSTQRLHERINMLGQARPSKIQPSAFDKTSFSQVRQVVDEDDDWIQPLSKTTFSIPPPSKEVSLTEQVSNALAGIDTSLTPKKMASTTHLPSPTKAAMAPTLQKPISVSNPSLPPFINTTTPIGSPPQSPKRLLEGPLSASKAKFYSVLKSAKGMFASSAGVSADAKLYHLNPSKKRKSSELETSQSPENDVEPKRALYSDPKRPDSPRFEARRTRSSTEQKKKKEDEERRKASDDLEKARIEERHRAAAAAAAAAVAKTNPVKPPTKMPSRPQLTRPATASSTDTDNDVPPPPPPPPKTGLPSSQNNQRALPPRRVPVPRSKEAAAAAAAKAKPAPVTIRMPSQRVGQPTSSQPVPNTASLSQSLHDTLPPPVPPKNGMTNKASNLTKHANSSTTSVRSATTTNAAKRALDAANKKKEQEQKLAQRKAEQKKELEQKRLQRLEEEKRLEQQRRANEQTRMQEARKAAQKQAEEAKKVQEQKRAERPPSRQNNNPANALLNEQSKPHNTQRGDLGGAKPLSKINLVHDPPRINPAKPAKRPMQFEDEPKPTIQKNPTYQQSEAKRRKTGDEDDFEQEPRSFNAPPVRQSNIQKQQVSKFTHTLMASQSGATASNQSMFVKTVTSAHKSAHPEMSKFANGHIPFAATTPGHASSQYPAKSPHMPPPSAAKSLRSSPHYPASESIHLPDIPTDSEDGDSDASPFQAPSWTNSPALRAALERQQLIDPETIFGPVAPLRMDEVFRNKDRVKKFRDRTSSANWTGADKLTEDERKGDRRARERMMQDGGWDMRGQKDALGSPFA